jgi:hypothetical protein
MNRELTASGRGVDSDVEEGAMLGFMVGLVAGGAAIWVWRERLEQMVHDRSPELRTKVADKLGRLEQKAEGAIDTAKGRITSGLRASQDYLRSGGPRSGSGPSDPLQ